MSPKKALLAGLFALLLLVGPALAAEAPAVGAAAKPANVSLKGSVFTPQVAMIQVNMTVTWNNDDEFNHDVTSVEGLFNSTGGPGGLAPGSKFTQNFTKAGVYDYYCTLHSSGRGDKMWGRVVVVEAPFVAVAGGAADVENPEHIGVNWLAHWVGIVSFVAVILTLLIYYFVLKFGETIHTTDHRDRKEK